jgi:hypothetical protein
MAGYSETAREGRLVCPTCENDDANSMLLFAETIETDCYSFDRLVDDVPVFAFGKSVDTESGPVPPSVQCSVCGTWWDAGDRNVCRALVGVNIASLSVHTQRELSAPACPHSR